MDQHSTSEYNEPWSAYSANYEVFIALRNVDYRYPCLKQNQRGLPVRVGLKNLARRVIAFMRPPAAQTWVQVGVTEIISKEKNPKFTSKLLFQCEECDAQGILMKFDVHDLLPRDQDAELLGSVEVALDVLLTAGAGGLELPIYSILEPFDPNSGMTVMKNRPEIEPGKIFLRAELLRPIDYAVLIKFGLRVNTGRCFPRKTPALPFFYEFYKLNESTLFEIPHPYTLVHRSEPIKHSGGNDDECWNYIVLPVSRVCNGELARVLKIEVYEAGSASGVVETHMPKGFALTTLRKMLVERELVLPITKHDGKISTTICLHASLCYEVQLHPFKYYINKGCTIRRLYGVDYSSSNWNVQLHRRCLHDTESGRTPYEEAIVMSAGSMLDIAQGDSLFYSFGSPTSQNSNSTMRPYVANFGQENHIRSLLGNYREALYGAKIGMQESLGGLHGSSSSFANRPSNLSRTGSCVSVGHGNKVPSAGGSQYMNNIDSGGFHQNSAIIGNKAQLAPLLNNVFEYLSDREENFEYHLMFLFTQGEISDTEQSMKVILNLAKLPISLIFVGIGLGAFTSLLEMEKEWYQSGDTPARKVVHLIHFRSLLDWDTSIKQSRFVTDPPEIFRKELGTILQEGLSSFMRIYRTAI